SIAARLRRVMSPPIGSIFKTSAPWSARNIVANGPETTLVKSITRTPVSGPGMVFSSLPATLFELLSRTQLSAIWQPGPIRRRSGRVQDAAYLEIIHILRLGPHVVIGGVEVGFEHALELSCDCARISARIFTGKKGFSLNAAMP